MSKDDLKNTAEYFTKATEIQGAACISVRDGYILMFKRPFLQEVLEKNPGNDKVMIFVKQSGFEN